MSIDVSGLSVSQLNELIKQAERAKVEAAGEAIRAVRDRVLKLLADEGLTFDQVFGKRPRILGSVKPKYRNPDNASQTWAGRGKRPRWFRDALNSGRAAESMLAN